MAITKTLINGDITTLYNWLVTNGTDYFTNIVDNTTYISCYVGDLEFLQINLRDGGSDAKGVTITTNAAQTSTINGNNYARYIQWAYKTSNALVFSTQLGGTSELFSLIITKDNNGNTAVVVVNSFVPTLTADNTAYAISTESETIDSVILRPNTGKYATAFCPLIVSGYTTRYLPNVFYMPFAQYNVEGNFLIDDVVYLCNGLIAAKDE